MDFNKTADYILNQLKSNGADDAECSVSNNVKTEIYYESGKIGLVRTNFNNSVSIKAIKDKKKGVVFSNSLEQEELDKVINDVMLNMEAAKPDEAEGICDIPDKNKFSKGPMKADKNIMYDLSLIHI